MKSITPNIFVEDISKTIKFYENLGFELVSKVPSENDVVWAMMVCGDILIMFQTFESIDGELSEVSRRNGGSLLLYIEVENVEELFDKINNKVEVLKGLEKSFYGATEFSIKDINNYVLTFAKNEK